MNQILSILFDLIGVNGTLFIQVVSLVVLGTAITWWVGRICFKFLKRIHFNNVVNRIGILNSLDKLNSTIDIEKLIRFIIRTFFFVLFSMFLCEALGLSAFSGLLTKIILYYPNIFISVLIFIISVYIIDFTQKIVIGTKTSQKITYSRFLGKIIDWSVRTLAFLAILYQLQIVPQLIIVIFIGFALSISLAIGISVGLAAKKPVGHLLKELQQSISKFF